MRDLKFKLNDPTLTSDVNQTLSNLLTQIGKTNKVVGTVSERVSVNTRSIASLPAPAAPPVLGSVFPVMDVFWSSPLSTFDAFPWTVITRVPGSSLVTFPTESSITIRIAANGGQTLGTIQNCCVKRTARDSTTVIDSTAITFGGTQNPTLGVGAFTSDPIKLVLDSDHDYFFMWFVPLLTGNDVLFQPFVSTLAEGGRYGTGADNTNDTNLNLGLTTNNGCVLKRWTAVSYD